MSRRRPGTCREPGPYATHCTEDPGHRYSCYDAGDDSSWNDRFPEDWQTDTPHDCGDSTCPDNPKPASCSSAVDCRADEHLLCCPSTSRAPQAPARAEHQTWERPDEVVEGLVQRAEIDVDAAGVVQISEVALAQLLVDAGWERTA